MDAEDELDAEEPVLPLEHAARPIAAPAAAAPLTKERLSMEIPISLLNQS